MAKKRSTKREAAQAKLRRLRWQQVNYFAVPKTLWKWIKPLLPKPPTGWPSCTSLALTSCSA